jgi:hypothetical protein
MVCVPDRLLGAGKVGDAIIVVLVEDHIVVDELLAQDKVEEVTTSGQRPTGK